MYKYDHLKISIELSGDELLVAVTESRAGVGEASARFNTVMLEELRRMKWEIQSGRLDRIEERGIRIFDKLFPSHLLELYRESRYRAGGQRLRLYLSTSSPVLAAVPWELAYDRNRGAYLALDPEISLIRSWPSRVPRPASPPVEQLRIMGVFPSPDDLGRLEVEREVDLLRAAIEIPRERGQIELELMVGNVTLHRLGEALHHGEHHVLHFSGHGAVDIELGSGVLVFEDEERRSVLVPGQALSTLLEGTGIRLATLVASDSAAFGLRDAPGGEVHAIAPTLVSAGVPAVVGFQATITDRGAVAFVRAFYSAMADGFPVDQAMAQARRAIYATGRESIDWATPVLYASGLIVDQSLHFAARPVVEQEQRVEATSGKSIFIFGGAAITGDVQVSGADIGVSQKVSSVMGDKAGDSVEIGKGEEAVSQEPTAEAPDEAEAIGPEEIARHIIALKEALLEEANLRPSERVRGLAFVEQVDFGLSRSPIDRSQTVRLLRQLGSISPAAGKKSADLRASLDL